MIHLLTGKIRSGKTLHAVGLAVRHLARGGVVYSNIEFYRDPLKALIRKRYRVEMLDEQLRDLQLNDSASWHEMICRGTRACKVLVILDEIHLYFNSRDWAKTQKLHATMLSFLSQSGKAFVDVIFIAQVATTLEKQFRVQCEWEFYCKNVSEIHVPVFGKLPMERMLLVQRDNAKDSTSNKPIRTQLLSYDRELWKVYNSFAFLDSNMQEWAGRNEVVEPYKLERIPYLNWSRVLRWLILAGLIVLWFWLRGFK